jgi:hypothetical protein
VSLLRLARNQVIYCEVNERLREIAGPAESPTEYLCECSDVACHETIELEVTEYEAVRAASRAFVITPGHERPEVERVVEENDRFALVEKFVPIDAADLSHLEQQSRPRLGL